MPGHGVVDDGALRHAVPTNAFPVRIIQALSRAFTLRALNSQ